MKSNCSVAIAVLAGIALGSLGTQVLRAQKTPPAFFIREDLDVSNPFDFYKYSASVPGTVAKYGGRYLIRSGQTETLEGEPLTRIAVIAFDSMADAKKWYASPEYSAVRPIHQRSVKSREFILEGIGE